MLQSMGWQRVRHGLVTEQQQEDDTNISQIAALMNRLLHGHLHKSNYHFFLAHPAHRTVWLFTIDNPHYIPARLKHNLTHIL